MTGSGQDRQESCQKEPSPLTTLTLNYDEEETIIKLMATKLIMNQLLNEVVEILEHVQYSRKKPEKYNYKSIFSCERFCRKYPSKPL